MDEASQDFHVRTTESGTNAPSQSVDVAQNSGNEIQSTVPSSKNKALAKGVIVGCIVILFIGLGVWSYMIVRNNLTDSASMRFARIVRLPAGFVNSTRITYADYIDDMLAVQRFYETNRKKDPNSVAPPADGELRKSVWGRLVRTALLEQFATKYNVDVTSQEVDEEFAKLSTALGSADAAEKMIQESYGWSSLAFKKRVITPFLLQQKIVTASSTSDAVNAKSRARAEEALAKAKEGKESFADLAKQYSEDGSAPLGGDVGWFDEQTVIKQFADAAFTLKRGEISGIVQSPYGFHIIKLLEREDKKGKPPRARAAHILIRSNIEQFIDDLEKQSVIKQWVRVE